MAQPGLFNGNQLPHYVFTSNVKTYLFIDFDIVFTEEYLQEFKKFLSSNQAIKITIENIEPKGFFFKEDIDVPNLPQSFIDSACKEKKQDYIDMEASFYMLTEQAIIYSSEDRELFCLYLARKFGIAILGVTKDYIQSFRKFEIEHLFSFLTMSFKNQKIPPDFKALLTENWKIQK